MCQVAVDGAGPRGMMACKLAIRQHVVICRDAAIQ